MEYVEIEVRQCYIQNMIFLWSYIKATFYMHQMISIFYILFSGCTNDDGSAGDGSEQGTCESGELCLTGSYCGPCK